MKVSIITTAFNSAKTIEDTIKSVINQSYSDIEYIIIDGGSTDGTLDIVNKYKEKISKIISEKDNGVYDAMNKGIRLSTGDIVGILNSDDFYTSNTVIEKVVSTIENDNVDCVWGDLVYVDKVNINKVIRNWKSSPYQDGNFQKGWHPPHPTFFCRKNVYEKYGLFREDLSTSADFELMLRFLEKNKISSSYIPETLVKMRNGGLSNNNYWNIIKNNISCYKAFKINDLKVDLFFIIKKLLYKIKQFK
jgi:glycosyltransferase involved in cell wall biosynthesis